MYDLLLSMKHKRMWASLKDHKSIPYDLYTMNNDEKTKMKNIIYQ